jgi:hypothetical protein
MTYRCKHLVIPLAGALIVSLAATAHAQSGRARERANDHSAVAKGTSNGTAAIQKGENHTSQAVNTGKVAEPRGVAALGGSSAAVVSATPAAGAAPIALALEDSGVPPSSNPEPLTVITIGGALAGLYRMRRHLT